MSKWLSTEKIAPKDDKEYLFVNQWGNIFLGQYFNGRWILDGNPENFVDNVTHWRKLPKPPKQ